MVGVGKKLTKIRILREFDGLLETGEMLVVLGRPGRSVVFDESGSAELTLVPFAAGAPLSSKRSLVRPTASTSRRRATYSIEVG